MHGQVIALDDAEFDVVALRSHNGHIGYDQFCLASLELNPGDIAE
jgi:hypothetical protein